MSLPGFRIYEICSYDAHAVFAFYASFNGRQLYTVLLAHCWQIGQNFVSALYSIQPLSV